MSAARFAWPRFVRDLLRRVRTFEIRRTYVVLVRRVITRGFGARAWQVQVSDCGSHVLATGVFESGNQTDLPLASAEFVPGQPEAVGRTQRRFALVFGYQFCREHEFLFRRWIVGIRVFIVERVDGQAAVDQDRILLLIRVEHQTATKSSYGRFAWLVQRRVRPHGSNAFRSLWLGFWHIDRQTFAQIPFRTSAQDGDDQQPSGGSHAAADAFRVLLVRVSVHVTQHAMNQTPFVVPSGVARLTC